jgi:hypothetical protein
MKLAHFFLLFFVAISLLACGSPERQAQRAQADASDAQAKVSNERLKLIEKYEECIADAGADTAKAEACDSYLKAANALQ